VTPIQFRPNAIERLVAFLAIPATFRSPEQRTTTVDRYGRGPTMIRRRILAFVLIAYLIFLLDLALFQFPAAHPTANVVPFRSIIRDWSHGGWPFVINFVGNIVAFLPMGLLPPLIFERLTKLWEVLVFSFCVSLLIEGGQLVTGRRVPDVDDLILNVLGGFLGYLSSRSLRPAV
jgi:glycopeptide antibiotics resistance protein